jgi:3-oxoacyl-[acyl-carrier protein] reductase
MSVGGFDGCVVLVTGGASGIGEATGRLFAARGARVVLLDVTDAQRVASEIPGAVTVQADVADAHAVAAAFLQASELVGEPDVVAHVAGVDDPEVKRMIGEQAAAGDGQLDITSRLSDERWRRMLSINLDGTFHVVRAALRVMIPRGSGAIVAVGSEAGVDGVPGYAHYAAAKGGVHAFMRSVAREVAGHGVRLNTVAPGVVQSPMRARTPPGMDLTTTLPPLGRHASTAEIASAVAFLASEEAGHIVGETLLVNGGRLTV